MAMRAGIDQNLAPEQRVPCLATEKFHALDALQACGERAEVCRCAGGRRRDRRVAWVANVQRRPVGEPFVDHTGHEYQAPPNRPRDREMVLPERESWGLTGSDAAVDPPPADAYARHKVKRPKTKRRRGPDAGEKAEIRRLRARLVREKRAFPRLGTDAQKKAARAAVDRTAARLDVLDMRLEDRRRARAFAKRNAKANKRRQAAAKARVRRKSAKAPATPKPKLSAQERLAAEIADLKAEVDRTRAAAHAQGPDPIDPELARLRKQFEDMGLKTIEVDTGRPRLHISGADADAIGVLEHA